MEIFLGCATGFGLAAVFAVVARIYIRRNLFDREEATQSSPLLMEKEPQSDATKVTSRYDQAPPREQLAASGR